MIQVYGSKKLPLVSVIIAVFNRASTLQRCISSVMNQTYPYKELIIMDGGSSDGTVDIIKRNRDKITYWESEADRGIYHAWNKSLDHAKGEWIYFLGSDDYLWRQNVLQDMVPYLVGNAPGVRIVYGGTNLVREDGTIIGTYGQPWDRIRRKFLQVMCIPHQGVFHHRSLFDIHGRFDESFHIAGDYELLLRELKTGVAKFVPNVVVAGMQYGGFSSKATHSIHTLREIARSRRKNGVHIIPLVWSWNYTKACIRHILSSNIGEHGTAYLVNLYRRLTGRRPV